MDCPRCSEQYFARQNAIYFSVSKNFPCAITDCLSSLWDSDKTLSPAQCSAVCGAILKFGNKKATLSSGLII